MTLRELLEHPVTWLTATLSVLAGLTGMFDVVWSIVSSTAGIWFPITATLASIVAPAVAWIPTELAQKVMLAGAILYMVVLLVRFGDRLTDRFGGNEQ